jgi:ABC-type bacteriocin/lantibiotic exporter with double-glycine peptidase domain
MLVEKQMQLQQDYSKAYGTAVSGIQTIESLKAGGNEGDFFSKWAGHQSKALDTTQRVELFGQILSVAPTFLNSLNSALIMLVGGFSIMNGLMSIGMFSSFQNLMSNFSQPMNKLINLGQTLQNTQMQILRLDDVFNYQTAPELTPEKIAEADYMPPAGKLTGLVEFKDVAFGYSSLEAPLIENFNLTIKPGERVALIGSSGSGKSTVGKLLAGLYKPWSGEILFDGVPLDKIPKHVFSASISSVDQEIILFNATVNENITLFNSIIESGDILNAAKDALIHKDIAALKSGYESVIDENGRNFSGGQRQRLEIARALATNPAILILDEATSALDTVTEKAVTDNIKKRGCSSLIVAHRLSTIRDCDEIVVMHQGKIAQRGTHEEMIKIDGLYKRLTAMA